MNAPSPDLRGRHLLGRAGLRRHRPRKGPSRAVRRHVPPQRSSHVVPQPEAARDPVRAEGDGTRTPPAAMRAVHAQPRLRMRLHRRGPRRRVHLRRQIPPDRCEPSTCRIRRTSQSSEARSCDPPRKGPSPFDRVRLSAPGGPGVGPCPPASRGARRSQPRAPCRDRRPERSR